MEDFFIRFFDNLGLKVTGPMKFRFVIQPLVSLYFAIKAVRRFSDTGRIPFFYGLFSDKDVRQELIVESWKDIGKLFVFAIILDVIAQIIILKTVYPFEAILTAVLLSIVPYILLRDPINRIYLYLKKRKEQKEN